MGHRDEAQANLAREHTLKDGRTVVVRSASPSDVPAIAGLYASLSDESARSRFHGLCTPAVLERLAAVGPPSGAVCVVAAPPDGPDRLAGEARYVPTGAGAAELALTVLDSYQGTGLGHILLDRLARLARESGISRLAALVSLSNGAMLHLLEQYGWVLTDQTDLGVVSLEISSSGGRPGWPEREGGRRVLVEQQSWFDSEEIAALRTAGDIVRVCLGPRSSSGRLCPLVSTGACRLAEGADVILARLPADNPDCAAVLDAHRRLWNSRLAP